MKILFISGSLRTGSYNTKLAEVASLVVAASEQSEFLSSEDLNLPLINQDIEAEMSPRFEALVDRVKAAQAVVICSPEYNGSISSVLKNFLDWTSRSKKNCWAGKPVLLTAASPGALGGIRGLWHDRNPLEALGAYVYPEMFGLPKANEAFGANGKLADAKNQERLETLIKKFMKYAETFNSKV